MRLWRRPVPIVVAAIVVLGGLAYLPSLRYPYLQDAVVTVARNPIVERGDWREIFGSDYWKQSASTARHLYRPVTVLSFALERRLTGAPNPLVSHVANVAFHEIAALLLFCYVRRLGARDGAAATAALLFTVHPLMLQAVTNAVGRADVLALLFTLAALLAALRAENRFAAWSSAGFVFLALGAKEVAIATPLLLLAQEALVGRGRERRLRLERAAALAPSALAVLVWLALRTRAIGVFPGLQDVPAEDNVIVLLGLEGAARVATALGMAARYAGLLFFPAALSADYSGTEIEAYRTLLAPVPALGLLFLGALAFIALRPLVSRPSSKSAVAAMGAWLFLLPYAVVGNVFVLNAAGFAERLLYVPAAGFAVVVAAAGQGLWARRPAWRPRLALALGVLLIASVAHTRSESRMWRSARELFERSLAAAPKSLRFNLALAHLHRRAGDLVSAQTFFERNTENAPTDAGSWSDLGIFLASVGEDARAERTLRTAIRLDPGRGEAWSNLGKILRRTGRPVEAERALKKALLLRPDLVNSAVELGHLLYDAGRYAEAAYFLRTELPEAARDLRGEAEDR